jgi:undecaprenyl-diphosphatase
VPPPRRGAAGALFITAGLLTSAEWLRSRRVTRARKRRAEDAADDRPRVWSGDWVGEGSPPPTVEAVHLAVGSDADDPTGRTLAQIGLREALIVGCFQVLALFPGISRSGATITGGIAAGLTREAATRFSFLLALPAMTGAAIVTAPGLREPDVYSGPEIALGVVAALVAGYLAIRFLVAFVARERLIPFAKYCVAAGLVALAAWYMIG